MEKISLKTRPNDFVEEKELNWTSIQKNFEEIFGSEIYSSWLRDISLIKNLTTMLFLVFKLDFSETGYLKYADKILGILQKHNEY